MRIGQSDFTKLVGFLAFAFILSSLVSCSSKLEDAIVGKWRRIGGMGPEKMELFKDGTLMQYHRRSISTNGEYLIVSGKYTFIDKDTIRVELGGEVGALAGPFEAIVSISGDEMTWQIIKGGYSRYRREK
jgi:hypothetical protein